MSKPQNINNGRLIRYRLENGQTAVGRVDLDAPSWSGPAIERDAAGAVEWFRVRQDGRAPFLVHVDDVVDQDDARRERDAAFRAN